MLARQRQAELAKHKAAEEEAERLRDAAVAAFAAEQKIVEQRKREEKLIQVRGIRSSACCCFEVEC